MEEVIASLLAAGVAMSAGSLVGAITAWRRSRQRARVAEKIVITSASGARIELDLPLDSDADRTAEALRELLNAVDAVDVPKRGSSPQGEPIE